MATPVQLTRATGLNRNSSSRLLMALGKRESLAALHALPGPEALRKFARGAKKVGSGASQLAVLSLALDRYEHLVKNEFDGKPALDAAIALWLPDARERVEAANRHLVYRGMSAIRGISVDTVFTFGFIAPSREVPERCDVVVCTGTLGIRRLVPSAPIRLLSVKHENPAQRYETVDGQPMSRRPIDGLLRRYCSVDMPRMHEQVMDSKTVWAVSEEDMGIDRSLDVVFAEVGIGLAFLNPPSGRRMGQAHTINQPTRHLNLDMFVHESVWAGLRPEAVVYDTTAYGNANFNDHSRDIDRVGMALQVTELGRGTDAIAAPTIPNYRTLANELCSLRGWEPRQFIGYRTACTYPLFAGQHSMIFTAK